MVPSSGFTLPDLTTETFLNTTKATLIGGSGSRYTGLGEAVKSFGLKFWGRIRASGLRLTVFAGLLFRIKRLRVYSQGLWGYSLSTSKLKNSWFRGFLKLGVPIWGPHNKDFIVFGGLYLGSLIYGTYFYVPQNSFVIPIAPLIP